MPAPMKSLVERTIQTVSEVPSNPDQPAWISAEFLDQAERVCRYVVPVVCLFGIACNALNLLVLTRRQMRGSPYTYLLGLAVTDVSVLTLSVIESALSKPYGDGVFFWQVYDTYVFLPVANVFTSSSVWITVLLTVERYISVRYPLKAKELCTSRLARRAIVVVVLLATIVNLPRFFCEEIVPRRRSPLPTPPSTPVPHPMSEKITSGDYRWNGISVTPTSTESASALTTSFVIEQFSTIVDPDQQVVIEYERKSTQFEGTQFFVAWTWFSIAAVHAVPCLTLLYLNAGLVAIVFRASQRRAALRGGSTTSGGHGCGSVGCSHAHQQQQQPRSWPMRWRLSAASSTVRWWTRSTTMTANAEAAVVNSVLVGGDGGIVTRPHINHHHQHHHQQQQQHHHHHHSTEQIRMTVTCISIICLFLVCIIPSAFSNRAVAKELFGRDKNMDEFIKSPFYRLMRVVTNLLVYCNLSLNFLLYCVFNHRFLHTLRLVCCRYWSQGSRRPDAGAAGPREPRPPQTSICAPIGCGNCLCCHACQSSYHGQTDNVVAGGGGGGEDINAHDLALNRLHTYHVSNITSAGSGGRNSSGGVREVTSGNVGGGSVGTVGGASRMPNEFLVLEVEAGLPVVISMQRRRAGYEALRSANGGQLALQFPMKERTKSRQNMFN